MYNTLKEIQAGLTEEELNKYAEEAVSKSALEIKELLKSNNIEISDAAAKQCVDYLKGIDALSDEELENAAGGGCKKPKPKYHVGQRLRDYVKFTHTTRFLTVKSIGAYDKGQGSYLYKVKYEDSEFDKDAYLDSDSSISPAD